MGYFKYFAGPTFLYMLYFLDISFLFQILRYFKSQIIGKIKLKNKKNWETVANIEEGYYQVSKQSSELFPNNRHLQKL